MTHKFYSSIKRLIILFAMAKKNYVPVAGIAFCEWAKNAVQYCREFCERWGVAPPEPDIEEEIDDLKQRVINCLMSASSVEVAEKNAMRKDIEQYLRGYLRGTVMYNPRVTDADRKAIGLHVPDVKPTAIGAPSGLPGAKVHYLHAGALELQIFHDEGEYDARANYGVRIVYDVFPLTPNEPIPANIKLLQRSIFVRRKKQVFLFEKEDSRRTAVFCLRYENSKGVAGLWGSFVSAVIP